MTTDEFNQTLFIILRKGVPAMNYQTSIKPMILMLTLILGFGGGIVFLAVQG
jgi:hypothetical protein